MQDGKLETGFSNECQPEVHKQIHFKIQFYTPSPFENKESQCVQSPSEVFLSTFLIDNINLCTFINTVSSY